MSSLALATANHFYLLQQKKGRSFPHHGFTPQAVLSKRFAENTSTLALSVGLFLPTMTQVHQELEQLTLERDDIPMEKVFMTMAEATKDNLALFGDKVARLAVQTAIACGLIRRKEPYSDSVVYLWNAYPGMHDYYVGEMLKYLKLPRFVATLFGPQASQEAVGIYTQNISPAAAAEDSMKRAVIDVAADIVVDTVRVFLPPWLLRLPEISFKRRLKLLVNDVAVRLTVSMTRVIGAGLGRAVGGHRGEYWGEIACVGLIPFFLGRVALLSPELRHRRRMGRRGKEGRDRSRSRSREDVKGRASGPHTRGARESTEGSR